MKKIIVLVLVTILVSLVSFNITYAVPETNNYDVETLDGPYIRIVDGGQIVKELHNDVNTLVFMVSELEGYAIEYLNGGTNIQINNLVLGYIRAININYYSGDCGNWSITAGELDVDFVNYMNLNDNASIKIMEYFANFVQNNEDLNLGVYGAFDSNNFEYYNFMIDHINEDYDTFNKIDLLHMIASIDGAYLYTENDGSLGYDFQRDLAGWAGDLQQFVYFDLFIDGWAIYELDEYEDSAAGYSNNIIDFQEYNNLYQNHISNPDLLADIDAMNITRMYLENNQLLSSSLDQYYSYTNFDNTISSNRYKLFIESVAIDSEFNFPNDIDIFKREVLTATGIYIDSSGNYESFQDLGQNPMYSILRGGLYNGFLDVPTESLRIYSAEFFIDYIMSMSTPPLPSGGGMPPGDPNPGPGFGFESIINPCIKEKEFTSNIRIE